MGVRRFALIAAIPMVLVAAAWAADTAPASGPASAPAKAGRIAAKETEALKAAVGKEATVFGEVSRVAESPSGSLTFINFKGLERGDFSVIVKKEHKEAVAKEFEGDLTKLKGKNVEVTGVIIEYQGRPEIDVAAVGQIKVVEKAEPAATAPAK